MKSGSLFFHSVFDIHPGEDEGDDKVDAHGDPEVHDVEHGQCGGRLDRRAPDIAGEGEEPAGESCTDASLFSSRHSMQLPAGT